ncbi:hypothetical protein ACHQM5_022985 [Ranunculus cassubicifolius]
MVQGKRKAVPGDDFDGDLNLKLSLSSSGSTKKVASSEPPPPSTLMLPSPNFSFEFEYEPPILSQATPFSIAPPSFSQTPPPIRAQPPLLDASNTIRRQTGRTRRSSTSSNNEVIHPPYDWATDRIAVVHSLEYLRSKNIRKITGDVQCKKCNAQSVYEFDLEEKFKEIAKFIRDNKEEMRERAPRCWLTPSLPHCIKCGEDDSLKPVMAEKKEHINWLFLLLGQMLGFCTLEQLKFFCQHTKNHRTGAKDRVLFLTYLAVCKQLDPTGPFER